MNKQHIALIVVSLLLIIAVGYIALIKVQQVNAAKNTALLQSGAQQGFQQAILQIMQMASTCQPVPLVFGNISMNLVALDCQTQAGVQQVYQQAILQIMQEAAKCQPVPVHAGNATMNLVATECLKTTPQQ